MAANRCRKIRNHSAALELMGKNGSSVRCYAAKVLSGDTSSRESVAASAYFKQMLPYGTRHDEPFSAALDYGYSVLRAGVARTAVAGGWLVSRGIHHSSDLNAFNLVDDLIEPFRPVVGIDVVRSDLQGPLTPASKKLRATAFAHLVICGGKRTTVQPAIERELDTLRESVLNRDASRHLLPEIEGCSYVGLGD